jgi:DNA-binding GntR family transcriptional regulator
MASCGDATAACNGAHCQVSEARLTKTVKTTAAGSMPRLSAEWWADQRQRHLHLQRAADVVRETVRGAILAGELAPGTRLREEELARGFAVSRTPVREALQQLGAEGLIELSPHQGGVVASLTVEDVLAIAVVREALEGVSARLAARRATPTQTQRLLALVAAMEAQSDSASPAQLADLNLQFHAELRQAAANRYLDRFLSQIEHAVRRFGQTTYAVPGRKEASIAEHRAIVEAVNARDPDRAEQLAIEHMREARHQRLRMLSEDH